MTKIIENTCIVRVANYRNVPTGFQLDILLFGTLRSHFSRGFCFVFALLAYCFARRTAISGINVANWRNICIINAIKSERRMSISFLSV